MTEEVARARLTRAAARLNRGSACALPPLIFLTDDDRVIKPLPAIRALPRGSLVILRARRTLWRKTLAEATARLAKEHALVWLIAGDPEEASRTGADGAHFPESRIAEAHHWRARRPDWFITCAAHSLGACVQIAAVGADAALLAPVFATKSHVGGRILGPLRLRLIAQQAPLPVYALGGVNADTSRRLEDARLAGLAAVDALAVEDQK